MPLMPIHSLGCYYANKQHKYETKTRMGPQSEKDKKHNITRTKLSK